MSWVHVVFQVQVAALQNLVKIMSLYYQYMESYMGPALFAVSCVCVRVRACACVCVRVRVRVRVCEQQAMLQCAAVCPVHRLLWRP